MKEPRLAPSRNVQLFADDLNELRLHAHARGVPVDQIIREAVHRALEVDAVIRLAAHRECGHWPPVTNPNPAAGEIEVESRLPLSDFEQSEAADDCDIPFDAGQSYRLSAEDMRRWENPTPLTEDQIRAAEDGAVKDKTPKETP